MKRIGYAALALCLVVGSASADTVNLVTGVSGNLGNGYFVRADQRSTGTGVIQSFVRLQNTPTEQGYNTSGRPVEFNENTSPQFTRNLQYFQIPTVIGTGFGVGGNQLPIGTAFKEFLLDINQTNANPLLSLNKVQLYTNASGSLTSLATIASTGTLEYNMDGLNDSEVLMDYSLNTGSGSGDMAMYVPVDDFGTIPANTFVYLYSQFGTTAGYTCNDGFEEWAVQTPELLIPLPPAAWAGMGTLAGLGLFRVIRRRKMA